MAAGKGQRPLRTGGQQPDHRAVMGQQAARLDPFHQRDRGRAACRFDQRAHDLLPGAVALGMDDAVAAVGGLEAKFQRPGGIAVEGNAAPRQFLDRLARGRSNTRYRLRIAQAVAGGKGVGGMEGGGIIGA